MEKGPERNASSAERYSYLIECSRASHDQLMHHTARRYSILKLQLLAQAALVALALGFSIGGVKGNPEGIPGILFLSLPISAVLAALYVVEDRLVAHFCEYFGTLSERERRLAGVPAPEVLANSEVSPQMKAFARTTLAIRFGAQCLAFLLIPAAVTFQRLWLTQAAWTWKHVAELVVNGALFVAICLLLTWAFAHHRRTAIRAESSRAAAQ